MRFIDHAEGGKILAQRIARLGVERPVVLVTPPSGPRIGREIAWRLNAPMDVLAVREVTIPGRGSGSLGTVVDGAFYLDELTCRREGVTREYARVLAWPEQGEEERWERAVRRKRPPVKLDGATAIVVSGIALSREQMLAVRDALRERKVDRIIHAALFARDENENPPIPLITLFSGDESHSVMLVNAGLQQTTDDEVAELLSAAAGA